jgi:hypothetical protein
MRTSCQHRVASEVGRRPAQDLVLLLQLFRTLPQLTVLDLQAAAGPLGRCGWRTVLTVGDPQPAGKTGLRDTEAAGDLSTRLVALAGDRNHVGAELLRICRGHDADRGAFLTGKESTEVWAVPYSGGVSSAPSTWGVRLLRLLCPGARSVRRRGPWLSVELVTNACRHVRVTAPVLTQSLRSELRGRWS